MKRIKIIAAACATTLAALPACDDFLSTRPYDALSPASTWKTEDDMEKFLIGCYDGWESAEVMTYWDAASDFGYANFSWEGWKGFGNGSVSAGDAGYNFYSFTTIRRVNTLLEHADDVAWSSEAARGNILAQARFIRAWRYFLMSNCYGGVPLVANYSTAQEAQVARNSLDEVRAFIRGELDEIIPLLDVDVERGRVSRGAAMALKMRLALYEGDWATARQAAQDIVDLGEYSLATDYAALFSNAGKDSPEIILAVQGLNTTYDLYMAYYFPNSVGGWSSVVPTQAAVDNYEMANGMTIDEEGSGYDPVHPFHGRDPRLGMTVIFPGSEYNGAVYNSLDQSVGGSSNPDYSTNADNATKTCYNYRKYADPLSQYSSIEGTDVSPIVFRYAEVLLTLAEAANEIDGPSERVYSALDEVRARVGMPAVDRVKYSTRETLRELVRRERGSEFVGEGLRRWDVLRWTLPDGRPLASRVMDGELRRITGTLVDNSDPTLRAVVNPGQTDLVETRTWHDRNVLLPIAQSYIDRNPQLTQTPGY